MSRNENNAEIKDTATTTDMPEITAVKVEVEHEEQAAPGEDHVAVDDMDAARMLKKTIATQVKEEELPLSANFTLSKILGGDILNAQLIRRQVWLMLLIGAFMMVYVYNRYRCQKDMIEIDRLTEQLKDAKYKALSSNSLVTEKFRESRVLELLKQNADSTLRLPMQPPYIINVPEK